MNRRNIIVCASTVGMMLAALGLAAALGHLDCFAPLWLFALLALPLLFWLSARSVSGLPPRTACAVLLLRSLMWILLTLCMADVQIVRSHEGLCVFYVLDQSASVPEPVTRQQLEYVNASVKTKDRHDTAGLIICAEDASVEVLPGPDLSVDRVYSHVGRNQTDLQAALELAAAAFPAGARKKIVLLTDGNENKGDLLEGIEFATGSKVAVDILPVTYDYVDEVLDDKV